MSRMMSEVDAHPESSVLKSCDEAPPPPGGPSPLPCVAPCCAKEEGERGDHDNGKQEQQKRAGIQGQPRRKPKVKGKLVRSLAVCEESLPLSPTDSTQEKQPSPPMRFQVAVGDGGDILAGYHDDDDDDVASCKEEVREKTKDSKAPLSKEPSLEYTDSTGIDLHQFILETLNSNPRDRMMLLKLEQDMIDYITSNSPFKKFPHMSSYHRMLVHRVAAYFGMEHNVDQTGKAVIINKTGSTRIPEQRFIDEVQEEKADEIQWRAILKRDNSSEDQSRLHPLREERRSKSIEEREEDYQRARDRIFSQEPTQENIEELNPYAETQKRRQLFRGNRDGSGSSRAGSSRQSSTETDCRYGDAARPWSSTDSDSSHQWPSPAPKHRSLANQSWDGRGAGSISLYRVPASCPRPSSPPITEQHASSAFILENGIPPGSILVNPQTGQPFLNPDGTPAVYNPPDNQQPIRSLPQQPGLPPQHQQPMGGLAVPQVVQYSSVSYPPQQMPISSSQQHFSGTEELSSQFGHVTLSCQSSGEGPPPLYPPPPQGYIYTAPPLPPPPPSNPPGYCQPPPQMPVYYYQGQYTSAPQQCRPPTPPQHSQATQQTGYAAVVSNQQQGFPGMMGMQPSQSQSQSLLGGYPPLPAHPCGMVQGGMAVSYSQGVGGDGGYCCMAPPPCGPPSMASPTMAPPPLLAPPPLQGWAGKY